MNEADRIETRLKEYIKDYVESAILKSEEKVKGWSDRDYAIKLVEKIVFGILSLFGAGTVAYLVSLLFKQ